MRIARRFWSFIRYFFIAIALFFAVIWALLSITDISSWACSTLSKRLSEELKMEVLVTKIAVYPPGFIELKNVQIDLPDTTSITLSSIQVMPTFITLPWKNLSFFYLGVHNIQVKLPRTSPHSHHIELLQHIPSHHETTANGAAARQEKKQAFLNTHLDDLHRFFNQSLSTFFRKIYIRKAHLSFNSMTKGQEKKDLNFAVQIKNLLLSSQRRLIQGRFTCLPLDPEIQKQVHKISWKMALREKALLEERNNTLSMRLSGLCEIAPFRKNPLFENPIDEKTNRKVVAFNGSLYEKSGQSISGSWAFTLFDSIDHLFSDSYISSRAKGRGKIQIEETGSCLVNLTSLRGNAHCFSQECSPSDVDSSAPMTLMLLHAKKTPFSTSSFSMNAGTIRLQISPSLDEFHNKPEKKPLFLLKSKEGKKSRLHISSPWRLEYTLPLIRFSSTDKIRHKNFQRDYASIGSTSLITKKGLNQSHTHQLFIDATIQEKILKIPIAALKAAFEWNDTTLPNGSLSLTSPILSIDGNLQTDQSKKDPLTALLTSIKIPSLQPFQFFSETSFDGSISCLTSWTASYAYPIPISWEIDMFLVNGSHLRYGAVAHIETISASLSLDKHRKVLVGNYILKNGSFRSQHWIELSKGALQYNARKEKLFIRHGFQKGSAQTIPYLVRHKGHFEKRAPHTIKKKNSHPLFSGMVIAQGRIGTELFSLNASASIPIVEKTSFQIVPSSHADLHFSGSVGEHGAFSCVGTLYDLRGEALFLHGKFSSIPSSIITDFARLPHAKGETSGHIQIETYQSKFFMKYGFAGNFNWLDRAAHNEPLHVSSTGEIGQSHIISRTILKDISSEQHDPMEIFLKLPIKNNTSQFPFFSPSYTAPLYGTIHGSCSLQTAISPWLEDDEWAEGRLEVHSKIRGTMQDHKVIGEISLHNGKFDLISLGSAFSDISIHGTLYGKDIYIDDLRATDAKKGSFFGTGSLLLPIDGKRDFSWKVHAESSNFEIINLEYVKSIVSGVVELAGTSNDLSVTGSMTSDSTLVDISKKIAIPIPDLDIVYINRSDMKDEEKSEAISSAKESFGLLLDLKIATKKPIEIKGRGLSSLWKGDINIVGSGSKPMLYGGFSTTQGGFVFAGKDFTISYGNVSFAGDPLRDSRLSISALSELPKVSARILVRGNIETPRLSLESNPMRTEKEILSLILFNKELTDVSPLESLQLASTALTLDQSAAPLQFLDTLKRKIGIDTFDFSSSKNGINSDVCVRIGKYISQGVTVNISKDFHSDANRIGVEVEIAKNISAEAEIGDDAQGIISIKWKKDF
ncbi:MAG: translocation/assembly module TamB domain-containing protein [Chlamydia sp.]